MFGKETINFEDVLVEMNNNLKKNAFKENTKRNDQRVKALELLNKAAENFEKAGLIKEADAIVRIMEMAQTEKLVKKKAEIVEQDVEIDIEENETPEEKALFEQLMSDPNVAIEVALDEPGEDDIPSVDVLSAMW